MRFPASVDGPSPSPIPVVTYTVSSVTAGLARIRHRFVGNEGRDGSLSVAPPEVSIGSPKRVDRSRAVADVDVTARDGGRSDGCARLRPPLDVAGRGVERGQRPVVRPDENEAVRDGGRSRTALWKRRRPSEVSCGRVEGEQSALVRISRTPRKSGCDEHGIARDDRTTRQPVDYPVLVRRRFGFCDVPELPLGNRRVASGDVLRGGVTDVRRRPVGDGPFVRCPVERGGGGRRTGGAPGDRADRADAEGGEEPPATGALEGHVSSHGCHAPYMSFL